MNKAQVVFSKLAEKLSPLFKGPLEAEKTIQW